MDLNEYQEKAMSTCMDTCDNDAYMFYGFVGEVGEFASKIAKSIRKGKIEFREDNNTHFSQANMEEYDALHEGLIGEIGDCLWFIAGISHKLGLKLNEVGQYNLDKLASRKERGKIDGNGDNR